MRALGLRVPGDVPLGPDGLHVAIVCCPAFSGEIVGVWLVADGADASVIGAIVRARSDLAAAASDGAVPLASPRGSAQKALTRGVASTSVRTLLELSVEALPEPPCVGTDGFAQTVAVARGAGPAEVVSAWSPRGRHAQVAGLLADLAAWYLGASWNLRPLDAVRAMALREMEEVGRPRHALPTSVEAGRVSLRRHESPSGASWELSVEPDDRAVLRMDGGRRWEAVLPPGSNLRVVRELDPTALRSLGKRVGLGALRLDLEAPGASLELRGADDRAEPSFEGLAVAARGRVLRLFALGEAVVSEGDDGGRALRAWLAELPDLHAPTDVRREGLFVRFRMFEPCYVRGGPTRWWSLFEDGVLQRFDGAGAAHRGVGRAPHEVPEALLAPARALLEDRAWWGSIDLTDALAYDDDDRSITLEVQWPGGDGLVSRTFEWSYGRAAPPLAPTQQAVLDRVYALYRALMAIRQLADLA
jgi:hypothetical protein